MALWRERVKLTGVATPGDGYGRAVAVNSATPAVYRRRRLVALAAIAAVAAIALLAFKALSGGGESAGAPKPSGGSAAAKPAATPKPKELPRGGRTILPE